MTETPNHGYNTPSQGTLNWHEPVNENFEQHDTDIEIRDEAHAMDEYTPKENAKFLATDTGNVFVGDGDQWNLLDTAARSGPSGLPTNIPEQNVHGYAEIKDSGGNLIQGGADFDDERDDWVEVLRFDHTFQLPVDVEKGELRGVREHRPLTFVKPFDRATPLLARALAEGETLTTVKLHWYDTEGIEFFTYTLTNCKVSNHRAFGSVPQEVVSLLYEEITWTVTDGNISYTDAWEGRG